MTPRRRESGSVLHVLVGCFGGGGVEWMFMGGVDVRWGDGFGGAERTRTVSILIWLGDAARRTLFVTGFDSP